MVAAGQLVGPALSEAASNLSAPCALTLLLPSVQPPRLGIGYIIAQCLGAVTGSFASFYSLPGAFPWLQRGALRPGSRSGSMPGWPDPAAGPRADHALFNPSCVRRGAADRSHVRHPGGAP